MDAIFKALNDPTRRALLDALRARDGQSLSDLEANTEMTRFGVMKHLKLLEEAGLVTTRKQGRFKYHYLNAVPLQEVIDRWIEPLLAKPMARGMLDLKAHLETEVPPPNPKGATMLDTDQKPDFVHQTLIRCTQDALWDALTRADLLAQYHFACDAAEGDAAVGEPTNMLRADGSVMLTQVTTRLDPKTRIEQTFEPNWFEGDNAKSRIVFVIEPEGTACKLTCEHYDIPAGQEGVAEGWARHIASLKSWLETGEPIKMGR
ncbi:ArsR/SmtB family transcription factor [Pseudaestuariivita atlantica]|uniref:ArsR family transcriptional regulator n=1 Tax=Pseudaestuariivita atlantica TaxID=1317121 RepID=A0A0L1JQL5_9RHOB|nr:metalloregulator ArsR/SmtB family transcription factor [Pseudaestuariivita atlantica]KNG94002.1 ArsR family transcriptional regulator [Pseudaestuariivita atlantica]